MALCDSGVWRTQTNVELYRIYAKPTISCGSGKGKTPVGGQVVWNVCQMHRHTFHQKKEGHPAEGSEGLEKENQRLDRVDPFD